MDSLNDMFTFDVANSEIHPVKIENQEVFGIHIDNFLAALPIYNLVIGADRIFSAMAKIDELTSQEELDGNQQAQLNRCYAHVVRGVVEVCFLGILPVIADLFKFAIESCVEGIRNGIANFTLKPDCEETFSYYEARIKSLQAEFINFYGGYIDPGLLKLTVPKKVEEYVQLMESADSFIKEIENRNLSEEYKFKIESLLKFNLAEGVEITHELKDHYTTDEFLSNFFPGQ